MKNKKIGYIIFCIYLIFSLSACMRDNVIENDKYYLPNEEENTIDYSEHSFSIHFIDVGQGDAALILCDDKSMLIDGGDPGAGRIIYTYLKKNNIKHLDYIVCSHADEDHIGGLAAPLTTIEVENILAPTVGADTKAYKNILKKTESQGLTIRHPTHGEKMFFASSEIEFYGPISEWSEKRNNSSIVMKIKYGDTSFLFTGDAEREEEQEILEAGYNLSATVLKVGHHGSKNSTTYPFLREIMPKYTIISVGKNSYGHPTEEVLSRLRDAGTKVYRTDMQGDIIVTSNGKSVNIMTQKNADIQTNPTIITEKNTENSNSSSDNNTVCTYIGNTKSRKFHYIFCDSVENMNEENKAYESCSREEMISKGYIPCKKCNP